MLLLLFLLGIIIGRNLNEIYRRTKKDTRQVLQTLVQTQAAGSAYLMVEAVFTLLMRKLADSKRQEHDMLHPCRKAVCLQCGGRPVTMATYARRLKAIQ